MGKIINAATTELFRIANNDDIGYSQEADERMTISRDCSSNIILAWEKAGIPVHSKYGATYTGNIKPAFLKAGFVDVTKLINLSTGEGLIIGDVLLRIGNHVAGYVGKNAAGVRQIIQAASNEKGTSTGGKIGDQTGKEIFIKEYYNSPPHWDVVLRYPEKEEDAPTPIEKGSFLVRVVCDTLNIRSGPGAKTRDVGDVKHDDVYTIVETVGSWGRLKSGVGWINIGPDYCKRV